MSFLHWVDLFSIQVILTQKRKKKQPPAPYQGLGAACAILEIAKINKCRNEYIAKKLHCYQFPSIFNLEKLQTAQFTGDREILGQKQYPIYFFKEQMHCEILPFPSGYTDRYFQAEGLLQALSPGTTCIPCLAFQVMWLTATFKGDAATVNSVGDRQA